MHTEQSERVRLAESMGSAPHDVYPIRVKVESDEHCGYTPANCPWGDACADCGMVEPRPAA